MRATLHRCCVSGVLILLASMCQAATLRVERDGSGDYTTLQPALDAVAAGDTVLVGPGEYTEMTNQYLPGNGDWIDVVGYIKVPNLTIIGADAENTILGPAIYTVNYLCNALAFIISGDLYLENITIRNCSHGMHVDNGRIFAESCSIENNAVGISWYSTEGGGGIWNSPFSSTIINGHGLFLLGTGQDIVMEGCTFENSAIEIQSLQGVQVRDCEMFGGKVGAQLEFGASVEFANCRIHDVSVVGIGLLPSNCYALIHDCEVAGGVHGVSAFEGGQVEVTQTIIQGGSYSSFYLVGSQAAYVRNCHLFKGSSEYSVYCVQYDGVRHDFRGNYWGTPDGSLISSWILDGHDDPLIRAEVLYAPFATGDSDLVVSLAPQDSTIVIPDTGGTFLYDATIENNTAADIVADLAIEAVLPDGTAYLVMTLPAVILSAASVTTRMGVVQSVPPAAPAGTYTYRVTASLGDSILVDSDEFPFEKQGVAVSGVAEMRWTVQGWEDEANPPVHQGAVRPMLHEAVPNPFNPTTTVAFELPTQEAVSLHVFDLQGRLVKTLLSGEALAQGRHEAVWDGRDEEGRQVASGTYFFRLEAGKHGQTKRAVLVK